MRELGAKPRYLYCSKEMKERLQEEVHDTLLKLNADYPEGPFYLFGLEVRASPFCTGSTVIVSGLDESNIVDTVF